MPKVTQKVAQPVEAQAVCLRNLLYLINTSLDLLDSEHLVAFPFNIIFFILKMGTIMSDLFVS